MFSSVFQPGLVSLFSSTSTDPLALFSSCTDQALAADSFTCLLNDSEGSEPSTGLSLIAPPSLGLDEDDTSDPSEGYTLNQTVLHIQSPTTRTTYIRCPPADNRAVLGMKHPWIHLHVRNLGREWSFEIGIVDKSGREGVIRCSTFQRQANLKLTSSPLLHLPLAFPSSSSHRLTGWCTIDLNLSSLLPHFSSGALIQSQEGSENGDQSTAGRVPSGAFSHVSYVKVYATCRLRRIWFSDTNNSQSLPWEFQLYSAQ